MNDAIAGDTPDEFVANGAETNAAPVAVKNRIESLDFIRGIAVMGILAANIVAFGQPFSAYMFPGSFLTEHGEASEWMTVIQFVFIDNKMRGLFTLLFGAGLYLFMERAWDRGETRWLQMWRLTVLLCFGLLHFFLIWMGDILLYYALIGFAVVPLLRASAKTQFAIGMAGYIAGALFYAAAMTFPYLVADTDFGQTEGMAEVSESLIQGKQESFADDAIATELKQSGDWFGLAQYRVADHLYDPLGNVFFFALETFPLMLLGVALYRTGFFSGGIDRKAMLRWGWGGLLIGGAVHLAMGLWVKSIGFTFYGMLAVYVGWSAIPQLLMVIGIAALLVVYSPGWTGWLAQRVRAAGRAAFTNYLGTSILMIFVFQGWGLGLFGELTRPELYGVTAVTCVIMLAWSKPWLDRYRYGPLEWLWRCLTYRTLFPLKR